MDDSKQLSLIASPAARVADPPTSHKAAVSVERTSSSTELAIVDVLRTGSMTTDEVATIMERHAPTIGTAISRLAKRGIVRPIGERMSKRGRPASVWHLVDAEDQQLRGAEEVRSARRLPRLEKIEILLCDGRVRLDRRDDEVVVATVRGFHDTYTVRCDETGFWTCTCPAGARRCTHAQAVALVVGLKPL